MNTSYGYTFYFDDGSDLLTFPITPGKLTVTIGSNNKVVTLINEGDINILRSPSLTEIEFEARFPMRKYPYSREPLNFESYYNKFRELKEDKKSFRFIVARNTNSANQGYDVNYLVALEEYSLVEDAEEGDDIIVSFKLKQYKQYGVVIHEATYDPSTTSTADGNRDNGNKGSTPVTYEVKSGDCLWNIAKAAYGSGSNWKAIYEANKEVIEAAAKARGKASSGEGHWIFPGTKLVIPDAKSADLNVQKLKNKTPTPTDDDATDSTRVGAAGVEHGGRGGTWGTGVTSKTIYVVEDDVKKATNDEKKFSAVSGKATVDSATYKKLTVKEERLQEELYAYYATPVGKVKYEVDKDGKPVGGA